MVYVRTQIKLEPRPGLRYGQGFLAIIPKLWKHVNCNMAREIFKVNYIEDITRRREDMNFMFERQDRTILFLPREHKIHIFEPTCNVLFIIWRLNIEQKQKAGIVTSLNDTTLTKVTYGKHATRVPDEVAYGMYEWFSS